MINFIRQEKLLAIIIFLSLLLIIIYLYDVYFNNSNSILDFKIEQEQIEKIEIKESIGNLPKLDGPIF